MTHNRFTPEQARSAEQARRAYEQERAQSLPQTDKPSLADFARSMTPEQFAYWVKGIADAASGFQPLEMLNRILAAARAVK